MVSDNFQILIVIFHQRDMLEFPGYLHGLDSKHVRLYLEVFCDSIVNRMSEHRFDDSFLNFPPKLQRRSLNNGLKPLKRPHYAIFLLLLSQLESALHMDMKQLEYWLLLDLISLLLEIYDLHIVIAKLGKYLVNLAKHLYELFRTFLLVLRNYHDFEHNDFQAFHD